MFPAVQCRRARLSVGTPLGTRAPTTLPSPKPSVYASPRTAYYRCLRTRTARCYVCSSSSVRSVVRTSSGHWQGQGRQGALEEETGCAAGTRRRGRRRRRRREKVQRQQEGGKGELQGRAESGGRAGSHSDELLVLKHELKNNNKHFTSHSLTVTQNV